MGGQLPFLPMARGELEGFEVELLLMPGGGGDELAKTFLSVGQVRSRRGCLLYCTSQ